MTFPQPFSYASLTLYPTQYPSQALIQRLNYNYSVRLFILLACLTFFSNKIPSPEHGVLSKLEIVAPEPEVAVTEPMVPKKSIYCKNKDTPKEKGIVIQKGTPEAAKSPLAPVGDKGKRVFKSLLLWRKGKRWWLLSSQGRNPWLQKLSLVTS